MNLNLEALLTLNVKNQHAVTHFKKETFTLLEYAQIFGSYVEEGVKRVTPWSAHYYTHPNSYYPVETSIDDQLVHVEIPKPIAEKLSRNYEAEMRLWAKRFGKCVRQRNVRQDNTMDRAGTLPLNLYESSTTLSSLNLHFVIGEEQNFTSVDTEIEPNEADQPDDDSDEDFEQCDYYSSSGINTTESDDDGDDGGFHILMPTRVGRQRVLTSRMKVSPVFVK